MRSRSATAISKRRRIRHGIGDNVEDSGVPELDDLRDRRENFRDHRLPYLVATYCGEVVGYIDAENTPSLRLHEKFGFSRVGFLQGVACRHRRWADTVVVQRSLGVGSTAPPCAAFG